MTVYLPRSHAALATPLPPDEADYAALDRRTILVVEDNADVRRVAVSLLEQLGYRAIEVETAAAALDVVVSGKHVDLVFSDVVLPGPADGSALARTLAERYPQIPVVLTTGYAKVFDADPGIRSCASLSDFDAWARDPRRAHSGGFRHPRCWRVDALTRSQAASPPIRQTPSSQSMRSGGSANVRRVKRPGRLARPPGRYIG